MARTNWSPVTKSDRSPPRLVAEGCSTGSALSGAWRKSSRSAQGGNDCVEASVRDDAVWVRDSKNPAGPVLTFGSAAWIRFVGAIKDGSLDPAAARHLVTCGCRIGRATASP